jgi:hypothetical protein
MYENTQEIASGLVKNDIKESYRLTKPGLKAPAESLGDEL